MNIFHFIGGGREILINISVANTEAPALANLHTKGALIIYFAVHHCLNFEVILLFRSHKKLKSLSLITR